jgi:hypothetical protein
MLTDLCRTNKPMTMNAPIVKIEVTTDKNLPNDLAPMAFLISWVKAYKKQAKKMGIEVVVTLSETIK